jgi:dihydrofolate reductase
MQKINLIVAMCKNNGIGIEGKIPWNIEADMKYFSKMTKGDGLNAVIMGKNTWDSLPLIRGEKRGLVGRHNFVLSTSIVIENDNETNYSHLLKTFKSIEDINAYLKKNNNAYEEIWVIGGEQIYKQFLEMKVIDKCYVTYIDKKYNCDTFFPILCSNEWKEVERNETYNISNECDVNYIVYDKINN